MDTTLWQLLGAALMLLAATIVYAACVVAGQSDDAMEDAAEDFRYP